MRKLTLFCAFIIAGIFGGCSTTENGTTENFSFDADGNTVLTPPPPGEGFQVQIPAFEVPPGKEIQRDYYITLPNDEDYEVGKIEIAMNEGTHHMNFFRTAIPDSVIKPSNKVVGQIRYTNNGKDTTQSCFYYDSSFYASSIFTESDILIEAQLAGKLYSWDLPKLADGSQATIRLVKHERMILQFHYVNAVTQTTKNGKGKISVNIWKAKGSAPTQSASMLFARKTKIVIPPAPVGGDTTVTFSKNCFFKAGTLSNAPIYLLGMTGHFHSRGVTFTVDKMKDSAGQSFVVQEKIYQSANWGEPPFTPFATPIKIDLPNGEYIRYTCVYKNNTQKGFTFGPNVETNEHMNLFAWFVPSYNNGHTLYDAD